MDEGVDEDELEGETLPADSHNQILRQILDNQTQVFLTLVCDDVLVGNPLYYLQKSGLMTSRLAKFAKPSALLLDCTI